MRGVLVVLMGLSLGCKDKPAADATAAGPSEETAAPAAHAVPVPAEMQAFLAGFAQGDGVEAALAEHGVGDLDSDGMELFDRKDPKVVARIDRAPVVGYDVEAASGVTVRIYRVCWEDGKIVEVKDRGLT